MELAKNFECLFGYLTYFAELKCSPSYQVRQALQACNPLHVHQNPERAYMGSLRLEKYTKLLFDKCLKCLVEQSILIEQIELFKSAD